MAMPTFETDNNDARNSRNLFNPARVDSFEHFQGLNEAMSRILSAHAADEVWAAVGDYVSHFGINLIIAMEAARVGRSLNDAILFSSTSAEYFRNFEAGMDYTQHPFIRRCIQSDAAFTIAEVREAARQAGTRWLELTSDIIRQGDGVVVPVYRGRDIIGGVTFAGLAPDMSAVTRSILQVIAHAALQKHLQLRDRKPAATQPILSVRETQCLRYVATGQEDTEISRILGISPRTVRFHVDSAKAKLGVGSRVQAVAKALRDRIITL